LEGEKTKKQVNDAIDFTALLTCMVTPQMKGEVSLQIHVHTTTLSSIHNGNRTKWGTIQ